LNTPVRRVAGTWWRTSPDVGVLEQLQHDDVSLVSWHRDLPPDLDEHLVAWVRRCPAQYDEIVAMPSYELSGAMRGLAEPVRGWLTADIAVLVARLAQIANARRLRVTFGAVRTDQCRKFHADYMRYRLITTYVGPGTQWVPDHAINRDALAHPAEGRCNEDIVRDATAIRNAVAGEVLLMKGSLHPSQHGAVHRSPPIEGTGRIRVVLVASTVDGS
jgi:hypothetical protein